MALLVFSRQTTKYHSHGNIPCFFHLGNIVAATKFARFAPPSFPRGSEYGFFRLVV